MDKEKFYNRLEKHPHLQQRFNEILAIAESENEGSYTADEIEEKMVAEVRKLGREVMEEWARSKVDKETQEQRKACPQSKLLKKN